VFDQTFPQAERDKNENSLICKFPLSLEKESTSLKDVPHLPHRVINLLLADGKRSFQLQ